MATFNIYGCCICRDLFGFIPYNQHEVVHFLQSSSQITNFVYTTKPQRLMTEADFENVDIANFKKKCIINDYNKTLVDYYKKPSDFFILDLINIANTNLRKETAKNGHEHYFTASAWYNIAYNQGLNKFFEGSKLESINRLDILKEIGYDSVIDGIIKWLKNDLHYRDEQIILIENKRTPYYVHNNKVYFFPEDNRTKINGIIDKLNDTFRKKCPNCHVIKMPVVTYADSSNPWSLTDLHFCHEFYEYLYKCVDEISKNPNFCHQKLESLREEYSQLFYDNLNKYLRNTIVGKQYLNADLSAPEGHYIADEGTAYYSDPFCKNPAGSLNHCSRVSNLTFPYSKIAEGYVKSDDCVKGIIGNNRNINADWKLVNNGTCVIFSDYSIKIKHCGNESKGQTNIIQTIDNIDELAAATVSFSVWTRVLQPSNDNQIGGTIAIINDDNYSKGQFYKSKTFKNSEWEKVVLTAKLPAKENFKGLTVCLRANIGVGNDAKNAIVEFAKPKLEIGKISTDFD